MSGADVLGEEALQAAREDGNESDLDKGDEVVLRSLKDNIQPPIARQPGEGPLDYPTDPGREEFPVPAAGDRFDRDTERLAGLGQALAAVAEIAQRRAPEPLVSEIAQHRDDALGIMGIRRRDVDGQWDAVLLDTEMDLDAADLLAAIDAAREATRGRATGAAVDDHGARLRGIAA